MKVVFWLEIGIGGRRKETFEYPDSVTDEELERDQAMWASNYIDSGFYAEQEESE